MRPSVMLSTLLLAATLLPVHAEDEQNLPSLENEPKQTEPSQRAQRRAAIDNMARETIKNLLEQSEDVGEIYARSVGYAVFDATKAGFGLSGVGGTGVAVDVKTGERTYMRMGGAGLGFGLGAQRYQIILLFETERRLERFVKGGWDATASAEAAAGKAGSAVGSSFFDHVAVFHLTEKGLMANAEISGRKFWQFNRLN